MILNKESLIVSRFCNKDETRAISGVLVEPDGTVVATDGHRIAKTSPPQDAPDEKAIRPEESFIIAKTIAEALAKDLKGKKNGDSTVSLLGRNNGTVAFRTTHLGFKKDFTADVKDEKFPDWREVISDCGSEEHLRVDVNPKYLMELAKAVIDFGGKSLSLYINTGEDYSPIGAVSKNLDTGQELLQALMPLRV